MRFELQAILIRDQYFVFHPIPAMVAVQEDGTPTGLAYHQGIRSMTSIHMQYANCYSLTHLASGLCISWDPSVKDEAIARRWLELIAPLADWVRPAWVLKQQASFLLEQVAVACLQACAEKEREEVKAAATLGVAFPGNACL